MAKKGTTHVPNINTFLVLSILFMSLIVMLTFLVKSSSNKSVVQTPKETKATSTGDIDLDLKQVDSQMDQMEEDDFDPNLVSEMEVGL